MHARLAEPGDQRVEMRSAPPDSASILPSMLPNAMIIAIDPSTFPTPSRKPRSSCPRSIPAISPMNSDARTSETTEFTLKRAMSRTRPTTANAV